MLSNKTDLFFPQCNEPLRFHFSISLHWPTIALGEMMKYLDERRSRVMHLSVDVSIRRPRCEADLACEALEKFFVYLLSFPFLTTLVLQGNALTANDLGERFFETLRDCQNLTVLDLGDNALGDEGLLRLSSNLPPKLERLILRKNGITNYGIVTFMGNTPPFVPCLDLSGNPLTESAYDCLMAARYYGYPWRELNLCHTRVNDPIVWSAYYNLNLPSTSVLNTIRASLDSVFSQLLPRVEVENLERLKTLVVRTWMGISFDSLETQEGLFEKIIHPTIAYLEALQKKYAISRGSVFSDYYRNEIVSSLKLFPPVHPLFVLANRLLAWGYATKPKTVKHAFYACFYEECANAQDPFKRYSIEVRRCHQFLLETLLGRKEESDYLRFSQGLQTFIFDYFSWHERGERDIKTRLQAVASSEWEIRKLMRRPTQSNYLSQLGHTFFTQRLPSVNPAPEARTPHRPPFQTQAR